jgi:hypothetical protein
MVMKVIRRAVYGLAAWLIIFVLVAIIGSVSNYVFLVLLVAPPLFYFLAVRCLRKKKPDFGSEGLKAGAIWLLVFGIMDFVFMPAVGFGVYSNYLSTILPYLLYLEVLTLPWFADMVMSGSRET